MARNIQKDTIEMAAKDQRILESAFRLFAENTIEKVKLTEVAAAAGIGIASLYRYYPSKPELVMAVNTWAWTNYLADNPLSLKDNMTGAEEFAVHLNAFLDLYRDHEDLLRFNQFFNVYIQSEDIATDKMQDYLQMIRKLEKPFAATCRKGRADGTIKTNLSEKKMFSVTLHLMLATVTRYAVGLAYNEDTDAEVELELLKEMLLSKFTD